MNTCVDYRLLGIVIEQHTDKIISKAKDKDGGSPRYFVHQVLGKGHVRFAGGFTTLIEARREAGAQPPVAPQGKRRG